MFMVFNRDKIKSYIVSLGTVVILFIMCFFITNNETNILETSVNTYTSNIVNNTSNETNNTNNYIK